MQTVILDFSRKNIIPPVHAKQGDVGRKFKAVLTDAGMTYAIPRGAQFSVWYSGASGDGNYSGIGDNSAFTVTENAVIVELITQMLTNAGTCSACLVMHGADGSQLGLWNIVVVVEPVPGMGSEAAEQHYTALSEVAEKAVKAAETFQTDTTLKVSGRAADATAVGTALEGKAPAGYGLGTTDPEYTTNADECRAFGVFATNWQTTNCPPFGEGTMFVVPRRWNECVQIAKHRDGTTCERVYFNGTWQPWEYVNPPMELGVEYRTTERWNGKAVYAKLLHIGALPNARLMGVDCKTTGATEVVTYNITTKRNDEASFTNTAMVDFVTGTYATIKDGNIEIGITTDRDASHLEAKLLVKYAKD